jgi:hypothetical protein
LRDLLASNTELAQKFAELERKLDTHDQAITGILKTIHDLLNQSVPVRAIGFTANVRNSK